MVSLRDMDEWERMVTDYGLLGLSPGYHPLGLARRQLPSDVLSAAELRVTRDGARVRVAGLVVCRQRPGTAKGFVFMLLEDETGLVNVVLRPDFYEVERSVLRGEPYLCFRGTVQIRSGSLNLIAEKVMPMTRMPGITRLRPSTGEPPPSFEPGEGPLPTPAFVPNARSSTFARLPAPASHDFH